LVVAAGEVDLQVVQDDDAQPAKSTLQKHKADRSMIFIFGVMLMMPNEKS
jgi:hypothetical protein